MKKDKNIVSLFVALAMMISMGCLVSCDSDDDVASSEVVLLSFGPTGVKHGDPIKFIGSNLDKVTSIELAGATIDRTSFTSQSSEMIEVIVPVGAAEGLVTLKTPDADIVSKTILSFEVLVSMESVPSEVKPGENMVITGNFLNWVTGARIGDVEITEMVSQSLNELVFTVPLEAKSGSLFVFTGGTEPETIRYPEDIVVTLPAITGLAPNPIDRGEELTITGTNLDLTKAVVFRGGASVSVSDFISASATELVVVVPEEANKGKVTLVAFSDEEVESENELEFLGGLPPPTALGLAFYTDALENGWQKWGGWGGGSSDIANEENVRDGSKAIKVIFGGDWGGALQLGGGNSSTAGYTEVAFSVFGTAGTNGRQLNAIIGGVESVIVIVEGEWTEYKIMLSNISSPAVVNELTFQDRGWSGTIYVDHIGMR